MLSPFKVNLARTTATYFAVLIFQQQKREVHITDSHKRATLETQKSVNWREHTRVREMAKVFASEGNAKAPKGHFVVYVGEGKRRYVVPISYLKTSIFKQLLQKAADEYGFQSHKGIVLPCDEFAFKQAIDDMKKAS